MLPAAGVTVARQPPHVRQQHRLRGPHPLEAPPGLGAGPARHLERFGIARCDAVVGADVDNHGRAIRAAQEEVRGMPTLTRPVVPVQPERLGGNTHHSRVEIHEHETVPLQPRLETDMLPRRRRPVPAREIAPSWRPPKRPYRTSILEPDRHTVQQRTPQTLALAHHTRHLDVRRRPFRPSRYRHTTPPACSPLTTRFTVKEAETTGFTIKRLDWMTKRLGSQSKDSIRPRQTGKSSTGLEPSPRPCQRKTFRKTPGRRPLVRPV